MKKLFLVVVCILTMASMAWGSPFLVCTVDPVVTNYLIKVNGADAIEVPAPLFWDIGPLVDGTYSLEIAAKNIWGSSTYVPFGFTKELPASPGGIGLSVD